MDTKSYFKNLTRSINYAVDDLLKVKYPSTYNLKNIKKAISEGNAEYRQARDAARRAEATNILRPATIPFDKDTALMNLKLDLKSGNFYNKNRIKAYEDKAMENAFTTSDYHTTYNGESVHYSDLVDLQSLLDFWIVNELFFNEDFMKKSTYFYKEVNEKAYMGPIWDMDWAASGAGQTSYYNKWQTQYFSANAQA